MGRQQERAKSAAIRASVAAAMLAGKPVPKGALAPVQPRPKPARQAIQEHVDATPERVRQSDGCYQIVDAIIDKAGEKAKLTRQFRDSWVDRLQARGHLSMAQAFACRWYAELHAAALSEPRVVADYGNGCGGSGSENYGQPLNRHQWDARKRLRAARAVIPGNMLALFERVVVDDDMPAFSNGQQRARFGSRIAAAAQPLAEWIKAPGA